MMFGEKEKKLKLKSTNQLLENKLRIVTNNEIEKKLELTRNGMTKDRVTRSKINIEIAFSFLWF